MDTKLILGLLTHAAIIGGIVAKLLLLYRVAVRVDKDVERVLRFGACAIGVMFSATAHGLGMSYANAILSSIGQSRMVLFGFLGVALPFLVGLVVARFCLGMLRHRTNVAVRLMLLVGAFTLAEFVELYAKAVHVGGLPITWVLAPNIIFTAVVTIYAIIGYEPDAS